MYIFHLWSRLNNVQCPEEGELQYKGDGMIVGNFKKSQLLPLRGTNSKS